MKQMNFFSVNALFLLSHTNFKTLFQIAFVIYLFIRWPLALHFSWSVKQFFFRTLLQNECERVRAVHCACVFGFCFVSFRLFTLYREHQLQFLFIHMYSIHSCNIFSNVTWIHKCLFCIVWMYRCQFTRERNNKAMEITTI